MMNLSIQHGVGILTVLASVALAGLLSLTGSSGEAQATGSPVAVLPPHGEAAGLTRAQPLDLARGRDVIAPHLVLDGQGQALVAMVAYDGQRERITLHREASPGVAEPVSDGALAWGPRLAPGLDGATWLAWSGRDDMPERGDLSRWILLRRVDGQPGPVTRIGLAGERSDAPDLVVDPQGFVHLAWESSDGRRSAVVYQQLGPDGVALGEPQILSEGWLARRPAVGLADGQLWLAWDSLVQEAPGNDPELNTPLDPDYDLLLRRKSQGLWSPILAVDSRPGIQAAPRLAPAPGGGMLVAYHASLPGGLVKWWSLRRVRGVEVQALASADPIAQIGPAGEQQGAEFPQLAVRPDGSVALLTRPSQGAYLHLVGAGQDAFSLDLTRSGWGARGRYAGLVALPDGGLVAVRRARKAVVLERFEAGSGGPSGAPEFVSVADPPKSVDAPAAQLQQPQGPTVLWGDLHMHSALSDGTGPPDEIYARCWARGMDFAALTDHDAIVGWRMLPSEHHELLDVTRLFDARDDFLAFHAFEWTSPPLPKGYGHRNVYFHGLPPTPVLGFRHGYDSTAKLMDVLGGEDAFVAPHHTTWTGTDWAAADPTLQRQVEIVSVHGVSEAPGGVIPARGAKEGGFVVDGLATGAVMGFLGGTDSHGLLWHHGLGVRRDPWAHALSCLVVEQPTREAAWQALVARRSCASTGVPLSVRIRVGGMPQGSQGVVRGLVVLDYEVEATLPLEALVVVRDGVELTRLPVEGRLASGTWSDRMVDAGAHSYYLRAQQAPRAGVPDLAWSSPVYLSVEP